MTGSPAISRDNGDTLIELLYDPVGRTTSFAISDGKRAWTQSEAMLRSGERITPYQASNNLIASGCVLLPSAVGAFGDKADLLQKVVGFIHRYVDLPDTFEVIAAHYVLLTWVYDAFTDLPYLRFRGDFGTGKTRALQTVGALCYKPFFASGASTVSPIFHIQDAFRGTLILDEADFRFSDATAPLVKLLNNGTTRGMPVLRTMTNRNRELNPQAFHVFGPKLIAMRERFSDLALESRFLTCETSGRPLRPNVPIHLPHAFETEARELRNRLLAWRFHSRFSVGPDPSRSAAGVAPRYRQASLALLSLIDDPDHRAVVERELAGEEARVLNERADTTEAAMLGAILDAARTGGGASILISDIAARFNAHAPAGTEQPMTHRWVGGFVRTRLKLSTVKSHGVYGVPRTELAKIIELAARYGLGADAAAFSTSARNRAEQSQNDAVQV